MVSHLFFYQLVRVALVWLCLVRHWVWPSDPAAVCPTAPAPPPPVPKRHQEPQSCAGLTTKVPCDACAPPSDLDSEAPRPPPPRIVPTRRRRRQVDTATHGCPNPDCRYQGWAGGGTIRANGHRHGGRWRPLRGLVCRGSFLEPLGTILPGQGAAVALIVRVSACLAAGVGSRGTARGCAVAPHTVLRWLVAAAEQLPAFARHVRHDVGGQQGQLDALFARLSAVQDGAGSAVEASARLQRSPQGVGGAMDPESPRRLAIDVGNRPLALAQRFVPHVAPVFAPDCAPLLLTDGWRAYMPAVRTPYGYSGQPPRRPEKGPPPRRTGCPCRRGAPPRGARPYASGAWCA